MAQQVIFSNDVAQALTNATTGRTYNRVAVLTDSNTRKLVLPSLASCPLLDGAHIIEIGTGDEYKNLDSLVHVWNELEAAGATRGSLLINLGGGVVTDLGGMAASTYKRGIDFVNVPTTLLSAVDAAVGGKTGINFGGLKNELGVFNEAMAVVISTCFFATLPDTELRSGYGEMIKHGLLSSREYFAQLMAVDLANVDSDQLLTLLERSVQVKRDIVAQDPHEQGIRRALNLGHTVGHAFESLALEKGKPIPHGYAVAWGLVAEAYLWHAKQGFESKLLYTLAEMVLETYGAYHITCDDYDRLLELMHHDKKSRHGEINCSMLADCGDIKVDIAVADDDMRSALDIYRDLLGI